MIVVSQMNSTYLQSLPRDCCLICHAPRTDDSSELHATLDSSGICDVQSVSFSLISIVAEGPVKC